MPIVGYQGTLNIIGLLINELIIQVVVSKHQCRCTNTLDSCWPSLNDWQQLNKSVGGRLIVPDSPLASCFSGESIACAKQLNQSMTTPFWDQHFAGGSFYTGWYRAWKPSVSIYAIAATCSFDIQASVLFAAHHNLRLVVKGTGSDYLGRSSAPGSLMVWTHHMQKIKWSRDNTSVTVEAGVRWGDVYDQAQARGRFVPGGQCPNVGAGGGYALGGGWSPFARLYGTISHNLLEAAVITADGRLVIANKDRNADLFWALRGGGGGTFGIAVNLTFRTWPAPSQVSYLQGNLVCPDERNLRSITEAFLSLYPKLAPERWSDKVFWNQYSLGFRLIFPGVQAEMVKKTFDSFLKNVSQSACNATQPLIFEDMPRIRVSSSARVARVFPYPWASIKRKGAPGLDSHWYDSGDTHQYYAYYTTRYIPAAEFEQPSVLTAKLMTLVRAGSTNGFLLQFNKALAGTSVPREDIPAPHPSAYDAAAFLDFGWVAKNYFALYPESRDTLGALSETIEGLCGGHGSICLQPSVLTEKEVSTCFASFRECIANAGDNNNPANLVDDIFPGTGTYVNEANFFEVNWQDKFWGQHYRRLRTIKDAVDPEGLFVCHHCVGSESWSNDGNCNLLDATIFT